MLKKILSFLLTAALLLSVTACAKEKEGVSGAVHGITPEQTSVPENPQGGTEPEADAEIALPPVPAQGVDYAAQLRCIAQNQTMWFSMDADVQGDMWYSVTDLDRNGRLEIIRGHQLDDSRGRSVTAFQVDEYASGLEPLEVSYGSGILLSPDIVNKPLSGYYDGENLYYLVEQNSCGMEGYAMMSIQGDTLLIEAIAVKQTVRGLYGGTEITYSDGRFDPITEQEFEDTLDGMYCRGAYLEACPGWLNLRAEDSAENFAQWSWDYFQNPLDNQIEWVDAGLPDLMVYFDVPGGDYGKLQGEYMRMRNGYEYESDDVIRIVSGNHNLEVTLEAVERVQIGPWENGVHHCYDVQTFRPAVGKIYEIPVVIPEENPELRLKITDGVYTDYLNLCAAAEDGYPIRYECVEMRLEELQGWLPIEEDAIINVCKVMAGWTAALGDSMQIPQQQYYSAIANAMTLNMLDIAERNSSGQMQVPTWLVEDYAKAMYLGLIAGDFGIPDMGAGQPVQLRDDPSGAMVKPDLTYNWKNIELVRIVAPEELDFEADRADAVAEFTVHGSYDDTVFVFLYRTEYNCFGWYIAETVKAMG